MAEEDVWKQRFLIFMLVRLAGVIVFLLGVAIAFSDLVREGGWPALGAVLAVVGALDATFSARVLKKVWDKEDAGRR